MNTSMAESKVPPTKTPQKVPVPLSTRFQSRYRSFAAGRLRFGRQKLSPLQTAGAVGLFVAISISIVLLVRASGPNKTIALNLNGATTGQVMTNSDGSMSFSGASDPMAGMPGMGDKGSFLRNPLLPARSDQYSNQPEANLATLLQRGATIACPSAFGACDNGDAGPQGQFRTYCAYSHFNYDDPIVHFNDPGSSHLHMYWGNTLTNAKTTKDSLVNSGGSTCEGFEANRSAYWMPAMLDANNKAVIPHDIYMYYKSGNGLAAQTNRMPQGLQLLAGSPSGNNPNPQYPEFEDVRWSCETGSVSHPYDGPTIPDSCPAGNGADGFPIKLYSLISFPTCLQVNPDGTPVLSSPDHRSHAKPFQSSGSTLFCPSTHPYIIPRITYLVSWPIESSYKGWHLSADRNRGAGNPDLPNGLSLHADWMGGWNNGIMDTWINKCIKPSRNCASGQLGAGSGIQLNRFPGDNAYTGPNHLTLP